MMSDHSNARDIKCRICNSNDMKDVKVPRISNWSAFVGVAICLLSVVTVGLGMWLVKIPPSAPRESWPPGLSQPVKEWWDIRALAIVFFSTLTLGLGGLLVFTRTMARCLGCGTMYLKGGTQSSPNYQPRNPGDG